MKKILCIFTAIIVIIMLVACCTTSNNVSEAASDSMFVEVERAGCWRVVYHKKTKVMYSVSNGGSSSLGYDRGSGVFTLLVNADGSPMLYEE